MKRKAQLSLVILIILLLTTLLIFFLLRKDNSEKRIGIIEENQLKKVNDYVSYCLKEITIKELKQLSSSGLLNPKYYVLSGKGKVAYIYNKKDLLPKISEIGKSISKSIEREIVECIEKFPDGEYFLSVSSSPEVEVKFGSGETEVELNVNLIIQHRGKEARINYFKESIDFDYPEIYILMRAVKDNARNNIVDLDIEGDFEKIRLIRFPKNIIIYEIYTYLEKEPLTYRFAVKYNG